MANAATTSALSLDDLFDMLADKIVDRLNGKAGAKPGKAEPEPEPDEELDEDVQARVDELVRKRIDSLRKMAVELGFDQSEVDAIKDKQELAVGIAKAEAEDANETDEDDDTDEDADEDDGEEDDGYDEMSLADLKAEAKELGYSAADIRGVKKSDLIDMLRNPADEENADEEDADEEGEEWYTREDLEEFSMAELRALAKDNDVKVPRGTKQDDLIDLLEPSDG